MATITATNQQYYHGYPIAQGNTTGAGNPNAQVAYQHHHQHHQSQAYSTASHSHHAMMSHHHQQQQQQQQHHELQSYQQQQQHHLHQQQQMATPPGATSLSAAAAAASTNAGSEFGLDDTKSTKKASKQRRDAINKEIAVLRDLLPLPDSTRQRLSQLQLMALVLVYVRKSNYFCNVFRNMGISREPTLAIPTCDFSKALNGFLMVLTQKGKLLYISPNAAEYLGHSMEDLVTHGDEVYDIIEDQDKKTVKIELLSNEDDSNQNSNSPKSTSSSSSSSSSTSSSSTSCGGALTSANQNGVYAPYGHSTSGLLMPTSETRIALCRMNVSRNARRQMRFGDQKVLLIEGHYHGVLPLSSRDEPVFVATCTPVAMPETRECVVQGSTYVFTSIHSMDMKFLYIDGIGEHYLDCTKQQLHGTSWYDLVHNDHLTEAQAKHKRITASEQERSTIVLLKLMNYQQNRSIWVHSVMQVKDSGDNVGQPVIVCTNQVLSEREAQVMRSNSWLYQFYSLHSRMQCNFSASSPTHATDQTIETPNSMASDSALNVVGSANSAAAADETVGQKLSASAKSSGNKSIKATTKTPPANVKLEQLTGGGSASPPTSNKLDYNQLSGANQQATMGYKTSGNKLAHSPSSSSATISPSPLGSAYQQQQQQQQQHQLQQQHHLAGTNNQRSYHQLIAPIGADHTAQLHHLQGAGSLGSSSASSVSSNSSSSASSTSSSADLTTLSAQNAMAVAAAAGNASLYGSIEAAMDPLAAAYPTIYSQHYASQMMQPASHHHHHHHHHQQPARHHSQQQAHAYQQQSHQAQQASHIGHVPHNHHHHHQSYHPYAHHHAAAAHHHHHSAAHQQQQQHHHHTNPHHQVQHHAGQHDAAAGLYATPTGHHQMAYPHHAAAAAAAAYQHPHQAVGIPNPTAAYHSVAAAAGAAAAAAAVAHQGVSFAHHTYNKIAAAVNASA